MSRNPDKSANIPVLGVALGSGGARGWAHIGVLRAMIENGVVPSVVSGTSMGALVGGVYCAGTLDVLHRFALDLDWKEVLTHFVEFNIPRSGIIEGGRIVEFVREHIVEPQFSDLGRPFRAVATDLLNGEEVVLAQGNVIEAIRASISIPGIFTPVTINGRMLVDGGLTNPVPVNVARAMGAAIVVAVDVSALPGQGAVLKRGRLSGRDDNVLKPLDSGDDHVLLQKLRQHVSRAKKRWLPEAWREWWRQAPEPNLFDVLGQTVRIMEAQVSAARLRMEPPDILLQPDVGDLSFMEFHRAPEAIAAGYEAAMEKMPVIRKIAAVR